MSESENPSQISRVPQERLSNSELVNTFPDADPDFDSMSADELEAFIAETDDAIVFGRDHGGEETFLIGLIQQRRRAEVQLARRNGRPDPFPLSYPLCLGKAEKAECLSGLPLMLSVDRLPEEGEEPIDWLIDGLIPKGCVVLLTGPPGSFKTFFSLSVSHSVAQGDPFLGRTLEAGSVTYIDRENPRSVFRHAATSDWRVSKSHLLAVMGRA
jgi:hypothetical protein